MEKKRKKKKKKKRRKKKKRKSVKKGKLARDLSVEIIYIWFNL